MGKTFVKLSRRDSAARRLVKENTARLCAKKWRKLAHHQERRQTVREIKLALGEAL